MRHLKLIPATISLLGCLAICNLASAQSSSADFETLVERFSKGEVSLKKDIDRCAETVAICAYVKGDGLVYGDGWNEDINLGIEYLKFAANNGIFDASDTLVELYSDPDYGVLSHQDTLKWSVKSLELARDPFDQDYAISILFNNDYDLIRTLPNWKSIITPKPRHRRSYAMGYDDADTPKLLTNAERRTLMNIRLAIQTGALSDYDTYLLLRFAGKGYQESYGALSEFLKSGLGERPDPELANEYRKAFATWASALDPIYRLEPIAFMSAYCLTTMDLTGQETSTELTQSRETLSYIEAIATRSNLIGGLPEVQKNEAYRTIRYAKLNGPDKAYCISDFREEAQRALARQP